MTDTLKLIIECLDWIQKRKAKDYEWADNNNAVKLLLQKIIDEISSLPSDTQWIDVNKRLPEKSWRCLVYWKANEEENWEYSVWFSDFSSLDKIFIYQLFWWIYKQKVTHWMPLPLPPNN